MKKTLREELERIHTLTYGKKIIEEQGFLDKLLTGVGLKDKEDVKKVDEPGKADLVTDDVNEFFKTLETEANSNGLTQQEKGSMEFQKGVESMQIGLMLLGYELPKHGVDGLFGPETAQAVRKFKKDNSILNEDAQDLRGTLSSLGYQEKSGQLSSGGDITDDISNIVSEILKEFKVQKPDVKVVATSGNDKFHKGLNYQSKHTLGQAVDLVLQPYTAENAKVFKSILDSYKSKNNKFGYIDEYTNPSGASTGGHFHLQYGDGSSSIGASAATEIATPEMLKKLIELLKQRGVKSEEIKKYIDSAVTTGGGAQFTDLDLTTEEGFKAYSLICNKFIANRPPNLLGITGDMLANGARNAFRKYRKYVPPELALAQLAAEGGIGNRDPESRPIRTKNPFNVGNVDSGANEYQNSVEDGIQRYYDLIAKDYLVKGKTANDLVQNFVNKNGSRYATAKYEPVINKLAGEANRIAAPIYASLEKKSGSSDTMLA